MGRFLSIVLLINIALGVSAQRSVTGRVLESSSGYPLHGATIKIQDRQGTAPHFSTSNDKGEFVVNGVDDGKQLITVTFIGFKPYTREVDIKSKGRNLGDIRLSEESQHLSEVTAQGRAIRATQIADTLSYNASAFKTMAGSSTEQLLTKMPGIVVENGTVQAQGEQVRRVLVDGKPFFEGDPTLALRNLPADIVESIQVFDKMSEQSELTGFDDGNSQKAINIVTRGRNSSSIFGKLSAGYGTEGRYQAGANVNIFNGDRRISILGMSNNVNQQNFSQEDLAGVMSAQGGQRRGPGGGPGGPRGGGSGQNFMIGQLQGVTNTNAIGFNYTDRLFNSMDITASYFFNQSENLNYGNNVRQFFDESRGIRTYEEIYDKEVDNLNHRFNLRMDWKINDRNTIRFTPSFSFQDNSSSSISDASTLYDGVASNRSEITNSSTTNAYTLGGDLVWRRGFSKRGRSFSIGVNGGLTNNEGNNPYYSLMSVYGSGVDDRVDTVRREKISDRDVVRLRANVHYSEPLSKFATLQATYRVNYNNSDLERITYNRLADANPHLALMDSALSNKYSSDYITQVVGAGVRYRNGSKLSAMFSVDMQYAKLMNDQIFPSESSLDRTFFTILPHLRADYKLDQQNSFRLQFRASTNEPSVSQLQEVIDESNPLSMTTGNPNLKQENSYSGSLRYTLTRSDGKTLLVMLGGTMVNNYISSHTIVADEPMDLGGGITLDKGAQLTRPENVSGNWNTNLLMTFGFPLDVLRSNVNISTSLLYNRLPGLYNYQKLTTNEFRVSPSVILSSNISDKLDFTLSYNSRFNFARNTLKSEENNRYLQQVATSKLAWEFWRGFTFEGIFTYQSYSGLSDGYNEHISMLNASVGKKFLKSKALEVKISAFDILRENKALARSVTDTYFEDQSYNVLKPYYMISCVYDLRIFKKS
ncbi:MAG: outer membrane beta-barrel protein [Bacteroidales bacterium]